MKITFMGAGSTVFARNVIGDCMCVPELRDSTFALYDIDGERLKESQTILEAMRQTKGGYGKIECYLGVENRKDALRGTTPAPSSTLRCPRSTACARPSAIPWALGASCAPCVPFPLWRTSPGTWRRFARTPCS